MKTQLQISKYPKADKLLMFNAIEDCVIIKLPLFENMCFNKLRIAAVFIY